jgi:hypothetical protein
VHRSLTGKSDGIMMGYFGNPVTPGSTFAFYYCDALYSTNWNKTHNNTGGFEGGVKRVGGVRLKTRGLGVL